MKKKTFIIAEAGVNHNGSLSKAHKLIKTAKKAGADAIKFQTFNSKLISTKLSKLAKYQQKKSKYLNQMEMLKKIELPLNSFKDLADHAKDAGLKFLSTAFDDESLDFLAKEVKVSILKIPSGEINNYQFLSKVKSKNLPVIISTGASNFKEIISVFNFFASRENKSKKLENLIKKKNIIFKKFNKKISILHCVSEYPAPLNSLNLKFIQKLKRNFPCNIGYSDHSRSIIAPSIAVTLGSSIIEKHFTLDNKLSGPDHLMSLNPNELKKTIEYIRNTELSLGVEKKIVTTAELKNRKVFRKYIVANLNIKRGESFTELNLTSKRSNNGISSSKYFQLIGKKSKFNFKKDQSIKC